jgi:hypothetical protein
MQNPASKVNGDARHIDSRQLAYKLRSKGPGQRAALAANLIEGKFQLNRLTDKQWASVFGVSVGTLKLALTLSPLERLAVVTGARPLVEPQARLERTVRRYGVERTWDAIVKEIG